MKKGLLFLLLPFMLTSCTSASNTDDLIAQSLIHKQFIDPESTAGPRFICQRVQVEELAEKNNWNTSEVQEIKNKSSFMLELDSENFIPGVRYTVFLVNLHYQKAKFGEYVANNEGKLKPLSGSLPLPIKICPAGYMKAEPCFFAAVASDNSVCYSESFVYDPYEASFKEGATITISLMSADAHRFKVNGNGFKSLESVTCISESGEEIIRTQVEVKPDGTFVHILDPAIEYKMGGLASYTLIRESGEEVKIPYKWGTTALKKM